MDQQKLYANLHSHSTHSDGVYTPGELVSVAKAEGYKALAVTDHDTVTACAELAKECGKAGLETVFGVEFTAPSPFFRGSFHITAYGFDPEYPEMAEYLRGMSKRETDQTRALFERGVSLGYLKDITWDEVLSYNEGITWLCNEHVFRAMKNKGLVKDIDYVPFFENVYGPHRNEVPPTYDFLKPKDLIALVKKAGGIAILAHPHGQLQYVDDLVGMGISGIEVWHNMLTNEEKDRAYKIGIEKNLFISGGSDHDGLLGGQYARHKDPKHCPFYAEPLSLGTTEHFFREIKNQKIER